MPSPPALTDRVLGDFRLREQIGAGGFGVVYRAEQITLGREAVVKVLHARQDEVREQRFLREVRLASLLDHPYAAHIYAFGAEPDGLLWIAMELVRGTPLGRLLADGPLPLAQLVPLLERVCEVVQTAHDQKIVHRDLKPSNIMVIERAGRLLPKLLDLGIARLDSEPAAPVAKDDDRKAAQEIAASTAVLGARAPGEASDESMRLTFQGAMGSPAYMSPEQWLDARGSDWRTDIYALGVVAYEALTGRLPFPATDSAELARAHATGPVPGAGPGHPPALDAVIARAMAKRPEDRFPSAVAFAAAFRQAAGLDDADDVPAPAPTTGDRFGPYEIVRPLAGDLYRARDTRGGGEVALVIGGARPAPVLDSGERDGRRWVATLLPGGDIAAAQLADLAAGALEAAARPRSGRAWAFAAIGLVAGAALALPFGRRASVRPAPRPSLQPLTHTGAEHSPDVSPDGRLLAFVSERSGRAHIWLKQLPFGAEAELTHAGGDGTPRFSPDGTQLLYTHEASLWRIPTVGGEARKLVDQAADGAWSPDGTRIAFVDQRAGGEGSYMTLAVVPASGGERVELYRAQGRLLHSPRFSPDGAHVAFTETANQFAGGDRIFVVPAGGGEAHALAALPVPAGLSSPAWIGPGTLGYLANEEGRSRARIHVGALVVQGLDGPPEITAWLPTWGRRAVRLGDDRWVVAVATPRQNLRRQDGDWLTRGATVDRQPRFSPDGQRLLFTSERSGNLDVWELTVASGSLVRITDHELDDWDPTYTPDQRRIVWSSRRSGAWEIWIADADGSDARQVTRDGVDAENPSVTPDGWIVYASFNPDPARRGIWRIREDGSSPARVLSWGGVPAVSPDGRHVAYRLIVGNDDVRVRVAAVDDGAATAFDARVGGPGAATADGVFYGRPVWAADGQTLSFLTPEGLVTQDFRPAEDTTATRRVVPADAIETFAVGPDGKLVVSVLERSASLQLVSGLVR